MLPTSVIGRPLAAASPAVRRAGLRAFASACPALDVSAARLSSPLALLTRSLPQVETRITVLPNRIQVATNEIASHIQSVGVIVAAGSRYETDDTRGFSYILSKMAFKVPSTLLPSAIVRLTLLSPF